MGRIDRILAAFAATPWFIHPEKAQQIVEVLSYRAEHGQGLPLERVDEDDDGQERRGAIAVLRLQGTVMPRSVMMHEISPSPSIEDFQSAFDAAANDDSVGAIVIEIDSPGGHVDKVPETVARIAAARRDDRPIVAVANTMAASAAYWIASAADEIVAAPSGVVGSIGVLVVHQEISRMLEREGVAVTVIKQGARKAEGLPFQPLDEAAQAHIRAHSAYYYDLFVAQVAEARGVPEATVRADPEAGGAHMGGGRSYPAEMARELGLVDRVETPEATIARLRADIAQRRRRRLAVS